MQFNIRDEVSSELCGIRLVVTYVSLIRFKAACGIMDVVQSSG